MKKKNNKSNEGSITNANSPFHTHTFSVETIQSESVLNATPYRLLLQKGTMVSMRK